ncbi:NAD-dependent dehydratase [Dyella lipolytica]|uniref:NAD-dependent epimerase/dehydratase family protein n=1 Tax=Dyella lipolytica TaxID=1867835 RepID=A0ABW8ITM1_9GAMM|nr:NAD-dependent epimerase/dehydratase family protein [Dyella lipolytica]GLQ47107.1 NAD-dependent dehydratase [Dyella lipolytica]
MSEHILVFGAGGFVGRHLVRALVEQGHKVIAISHHPITFGEAGVETVIGELNKPEQFAPLIDRSRVVVHLASRSTPGNSAGRVMAELQNNLQPTFALLEALQDKPKTELLYLSSGGSLYTTAPTELTTESATTHPRSYHGAGKAAAEHFIFAWCSQFGGAATVLRPSNIYGPGQTERAGFGIVPTSFGKIVRGEHLTVWGDGTAIRDYLYIDDFLSLCMAILTSPMPPGMRVLNAASGIGISLNDLFKVLENVTGRQLPRIYDAGRKVDALRVVMDVALAHEYYGWEPLTSLHEGLRQTWDWFTTTQR